MKHIYNYTYHFLFLFLLLVSTPALGQRVEATDKIELDSDGLPAIPPVSVQKTTKIFDYAHLLQAEEKQQLQHRVGEYFDKTSTQIVIATVDKVNDDISLYATEWAHKWGIGQKNKGNGVFILISKGDRKVTIRSGYGVEPMLTDALSRRIIEEKMIPYFKRGNYYKGLDEAITAIQQVLAGEFKNDLKNQDEGIPFWVILLIIFIVIILISSFGKGGHGGGGWHSSGGGPIIFSGSGRSSWGSGGGFGGGSFGGGFGGGSFGGGGFGGGGATGGW